MSWHFLQCPTVPIRITEVDILYTPQIDNLTHFNAPACERFAGLVDVRYDQMQPLDRSRPHCRNFAHTGPNDDRTSRSGWCELDHSHSVPRLDIMVCVKSDLFNVKYLGAVNVRNWDRHQFKFHLHLASCSFLLIQWHKQNKRDNDLCSMKGSESPRFSRKDPCKSSYI